MDDGDHTVSRDGCIDLDTDGTRINHFGACIGVAFNIYRTYWNRAQTIISDKHLDGQYDRCVIIESE